MKSKYVNSDSLGDGMSISGLESEQSYERAVKALQNRNALRNELQSRHLYAEAPLGNSFQHWKKEVLEYERLISLKHLSESDAEKLDELLENAENNNILSFWFARADEFVLETRKGVLSCDHIQYYQAAQKALRMSFKEQYSDCCDEEDGCHSEEK